MRFADRWQWIVDRFRPIDYATYEVFLMRVFFAFVVAGAIPNKLPFVGQKEPVGLARFCDLTFLGDPAVLEPVRIVFWICLGLYAVGFASAFALPVAALLFNAVGALIGSQGAHKHHLQIVGLVLVVLAVYHVYLAVRYRRLFLPTLENHRFAIFHAQQTVVATYLVTGLYKALHSGIGWVVDAKYFPLQLAKTRGMDYYNRLEEAGGEAGSGAQELLANLSPAIERFFIDYPNWARFFLGSGLLLELGAFLLMAGRWWGVGYGCLIILFHLTVSRVMHLTFEYNILLVAVFFINLPWLIVTIGKKLRRVKA
jgi:hypothetical protein